MCCLGCHHADNGNRRRQRRSQPAQVAFYAIVIGVGAAACSENSTYDEAHQGTYEVAPNNSTWLGQRYFRYSIDENSGGALSGIVIISYVTIFCTVGPFLV